MPPDVHLVGWGFIALYTVAFMCSILLLIAPLLVTLALKVNSLVGIERGAEQPGSRRRRRRPAGDVRQPALRQAERPHLVAARACDDPGWSSGWSAAPRASSSSPWHPASRSSCSDGASPSCASTRCSRPWSPSCPTRCPSPSAAWSPGSWASACPVASVAGTFLVKLFAGNQVAMFMAPCALGGVVILLFAVTLDDRRLAGADKPAWSLARARRARSASARAGARTSPGRSPAGSCSSWPTPSSPPTRPTTCSTSSAAPRPRCRSRSSSAPWSSRSSSSRRPSSGAGSRTGQGAGRSSSSPRPSSTALALFLIASASGFNGFLVGMALGGLGFGRVHGRRPRPRRGRAARPGHRRQGPRRVQHRRRPPLARSRRRSHRRILAVGGGSYGVLYTVAGICALLGAVAIRFVKRVR